MVSRAAKILLHESYELALERDDDFPRLFYDIFFHRHPDVERLFVNNTHNAQRVMFGQKLSAIVDHIDDDAWLARTLGPMGRQHVGYGVTPEMYAQLGACLIEAVRTVCAADWTAAHEAAWAAAYAKVTDIMLAGAASE